MGAGGLNPPLPLTLTTADTPTRRQTNLPKLIYGHFGTRRNAVESMKVALADG